MSEWTREELLLDEESELDKQDARDDAESLARILDIEDKYRVKKLTDFFASNYRACRRVWAGAAFDVDRERIAALESQLAELRDQLRIEVAETTKRMDRINDLENTVAELRQRTEPEKWRETLKAIIDDHDERVRTYPDQQQPHRVKVMEEARTLLSPPSEGGKT